MSFGPKIILLQVEVVLFESKGMSSKPRNPHSCYLYTKEELLVVAMLVFASAFTSGLSLTSLAAIMITHVSTVPYLSLDSIIKENTTTFEFCLFRYIE